MSDTNKTPVAISYEGKLVRLRPVKESDWETALPWRNNPSIRDNQIGYRYPVTAEMEKSWIKKAMDGGDADRTTFAIDTSHDDRHIGFVHLVDIDMISNHAQFGISIGDESQHGEGKGREASILMIKHAHGVLNLHRLWLLVPAFNKAAINMYSKLGFQEEGRLRKHLFLGNAYHDVLTMGLLRDEFVDPVL